MTSTTTASDSLARWLIRCETRDDDEAPAARAAAAVRVFDKLSQRLAVLITPIGAEALLARAVHLSRATYPFLDHVEAKPKGTSLIATLQAAAANVEPSQAQEGFVLVLGTLVGLLESFIGKDLTLRLLADVWPEQARVPQPASDADQLTGTLELQH